MKTTNFRNVKRILVIKLRHIGDVILSVPAFRALRENFPDSHIAALVNSGTEEVLSGNHLIDEIIIFDRDIKKMDLLHRYIRELSFIKTIRMKGFDMTVDLTSGDRAAIVSLLSGAQYRIAYSPKKEGLLAKRYLYTHLAKKQAGQHMVLQNLEVVRQFGIDTQDTHLNFFIPEEAKRLVRRVFEENNINPPSPTCNCYFWCRGQELETTLTSASSPIQTRCATACAPYRRSRQSEPSSDNSG